MNPRQLIHPGGISAALLITAAGCASSTSSPFYDQTEADLRRSVIESAQRELAEPARRPTPVTTTRDEGVERLGIKPEVMPELEGMAGPGSYERQSLQFEKSLTNEPPETLVVNLERMVRTAVTNNVALQFARVGPAIAESQVVAAEAAFDWVFFSNLNYVDTDSPRVAQFVGSASREDSTAISNTTGVRRTLIGGGRLTAQTEISHTDTETVIGNQFNNPNPADQVSLVLQYDQPLLRNFGSEVSQAEIRVARNAERNAVQTLRRDMIRVVTDTERTYWQLVQAYYDVVILERLLERGEKVQNQLLQRQDIDANRAQIADSTARVEQRRGDVLNARTRLRQISDRLKLLVNDPDFPVGSEIVLVPTDDAVDQPVTFSLVESLRAALRHRPEVQQAVISIDDASIRQTVARNSRLPDLSMRLQTRVTGLSDDFGNAVDETFSADFIDYVVGLAFEVPIGYRRGEAEYRRRMLERLQATLAYRNTVQTVVTEVRAALMSITEGYMQIAQQKTGRLAAAEVLRILLVEKELGQVGFTVERLDYELRQQEQLALAERREIEALIQYNTSIADLYAAMGTSLERNGVRLVIPTGEDVLWDAGEGAIPTSLPAPVE